MQILRGILLTVGIGLVCLAACATEWEPVPMLLMGGSGLVLCGIAKGIKKPPDALEHVEAAERGESSDKV